MGGKQLGFGDYEQSTTKKRTKRERFLGDMEKVVPWKALLELIEPHYPKTSSKGGRPPYPLATMLRIHLLQQWYDLSDPAREDALIEVPTMRRFAGIGFRVAMRPGNRRVLPDTPGGGLDDLVETAKAHIRVKVEHPFRVIKRQCGFQKTRLRGMVKNRCKVNVLAALSNLFMARGRLLCSI